MTKIYCIRCNKFAESKMPNVSCTSNEKTMLSANCYESNSKKNRFIN